ncbi:MAG: hypothetical protein FWD44_07695 [Oscillospiraceae bacterium]|nr:hypothetical protein [Oscillospiraceae bacterium]
MTNINLSVKIAELWVSYREPNRGKFFEGVYGKINRELILAELLKSRDAIDTAIAYVRAEETGAVRSQIRAKTIRAGEGRAVAILTNLRDAGGVMGQRDFEEACLRNCRTLVGAGGFIARGSITRETASGGDVIYKLTDKGEDTVNKWEARYGGCWANALEHEDILGDLGINDHQKIRLINS